MLWVLRTGAQWQDLPGRYGTKSTCHRRFQQWVDTGVFEQILKTLAEDLNKRGGLDLSECFVDATFASAKKGDLVWVPPVGVRAARSWQWLSQAGLPLAIDVASASPAEVQLVAPVLQRRFTDALPERLIGDKAYDSDGLDAQLRREGIEMIAPNRAKRRKTQDGRPLRRDRRRWKVERLMAWLHNFRRIVTRWEYKVQNYLGFVHLGCIRILLWQPAFMG